MTIDMSQFYEVFFDEAEELLAETERLLLGIDVQNPDTEELNAIFRAAHSIKGGAATFGFMDMTEITHVLENLLDKIRKHEMALTAEHVDAFLAAKDVLKMEVDGHRLATDVDQEQVADVKMMLKSLSEAGGMVISAAPTSHEPETVPVSAAPVVEALKLIETPKLEPVAAPEVAAPVSADGLTRFNIELPEVSDKDLANLKDELGLLGEVVSSKNDKGRYVFNLATDSSQADIISICSFILDPDDLKISIVGATATVSAPTESKEQAKPAVVEDAGFGLFEDDDVIVEATPATNAEETGNSSGVKVVEEVGYGLFATEGKEKGLYAF